MAEVAAAHPVPVVRTRPQQSIPHLAPRPRRDLELCQSGQFELLLERISGPINFSRWRLILALCAFQQQYVRAPAAGSLYVGAATAWA